MISVLAYKLMQIQSETSADEFTPSLSPNPASGKGIDEGVVQSNKTELAEY